MSTSNGSVDELELFDGQPSKKGQDYWIFVITVEWISLAQAPRAKAMTIVANNEECFSSEIAVFLYNLYYHQCCVIKTGT